MTRTNPIRRTKDAHDNERSLWWAYGMKGLAALKQKRARGVTLPFVVKATQLQEEGLELVSVVADKRDLVIGAGMSVDEVDEIVVLKYRGAHEVAETMLAMWRAGKLPGVATHPIRQLIAPHKAEMRGANRDRERVEYEVLSMFDQERVADAVIRGLVRLRWRR